MFPIPNFVVAPNGATPSPSPPPPALTVTSGTGTAAPGGFTSPFQNIVGVRPNTTAAPTQTPFASIATTPANGPPRTGVTPVFQSPFSGLSTSPAPATATATAFGNTTAHAFPPPPMTAGLFPTPTQAAQAFPPPSFAMKATPNPSLSFPAPSFAHSPHSPSNLPSLPSSQANSATPTAHSSIAPSRFGSAPTSASVSMAPSRMGSGPSSAVQSKHGSPTLTAMRGEPPPFAPLSGPSSHVSTSKGVSLGLFGVGHSSLHATPTNTTPTNASLAPSPITSPTIKTHTPPPNLMPPKIIVGAHLKPIPVQGDAAANTRNTAPFNSTRSANSTTDGIPSFPSYLRATECSSLASILTGFVPTPPTKSLDPFIVSTPSFASPALTPVLYRTPSQADLSADALHKVLAQVNFSLASLVSDAAAQMTAAAAAAAAAEPTAPTPPVFFDPLAPSSSTGASLLLKPFDFSAPSPDDLAKARLQAVPNRGSSTDAASAEQLKERALRKKRAAGTGGRLARDIDEDEEDGDEAGPFMHASSDRRALFGGLVNLSTGSVGSAAAQALQALAESSKSAYTSRPFQALQKSITALKRPLLEDLVRGAHAFALLAQYTVREPRRRGDAPLASSSTSSASDSKSNGVPPLDHALFHTLEESWQPKGLSSAPHFVSAFTPAAMPYQIAAAHTNMQQCKARAVDNTLDQAAAIMPDAIKALYHRKRKIYSSDRLSLPVHTAALSDQPIELVTPTPQPSFLPTLASLNMLVVGAPHAGVSTLLGNMLYDLGRLPFSMVRPKHLTPNYWEEFNGQQLLNHAITAVVPTNTNAKLNAWNQAKYNFKNYTHCFYTDRYRINVMHQNMGGIIHPATTTTTSKHQPPPTPQQINLSTLASLQADFVFLVVDASAGSTFEPTPLMQQQLLIAYLVGVRQVLLVLTRMDSCAWSEKKVQSTVAGVISSFLKPLGFQAQNIVTIPVSGLTGENIMRPIKKEVCEWYEGPTLHQIIDRITMPVHRQIESIADRGLSAMVLESPKSISSILNSDTLDSVKLKVQILSGLLIHSEPIALLDSRRGPIGPIGIRQLERQESIDSRDLALYVDEEQEPNNNTNATKDANDPTHKKLTRDAATGKKLTNNERKLAMVAAKREHARQAQKEKALAKSAIKQEWQKYEEEEDEYLSDDDVDGGEDSSAIPSSSSSSSSSSLPVSSSMHSLAPSPILAPGDIGVLTLSTMRPPASNSDDELTTMLTGRNAAELVATQSTKAMAHVATDAKAGDIIVLPSDTDSLRSVRTFKAEVLSLMSWPSSLHLKGGQSVLFVPIRTNLPSPTSVTHNSTPSMWKMVCDEQMKVNKHTPQPHGSTMVLMERLVNILNKSNRSALRKKPDFLCGPSVDGVSLTAGDLATVEFSSTTPIVIDTFNTGGPRLANFFIVHQQEIIALACVTQAQ